MRDGDNFDNDVELAAGTNPDDISDYSDIIAPILAAEGAGKPADPVHCSD